MPGTPEVTATATPAPTAPPHTDRTLSEVTGSTTGWRTFSSPEYPITFQFPPDWTVRFAHYTPATTKVLQLTKAGIVDGCSLEGCAAYVSPPGQNVEGGDAVVLTRTGFRGDPMGWRYEGATVLAAVPDLLVWASPEAGSRSTAVLATRSADGYCLRGCSPGEDFGPPYKYLLSTRELAAELAVGDANPVTGHQEAAFTFGTNWGPAGENAKTVATILASTRENPGFEPSQPDKRS